MDVALFLLPSQNPLHVIFKMVLEMKFSSELAKHLHRSQLSLSTFFFSFPQSIWCSVSQASSLSLFVCRIIHSKLGRGQPAEWPLLMFSLLRFGREYKVYHLLTSTILIRRPAQSKNVLSKISRKKSILLKDISASFWGFKCRAFGSPGYFWGEISQIMKA